MRICFYGGPGVGKSTLAAKLYAELKPFVSVELVQEFIKPWAYEKKPLDAFDQVLSFAKQLWNEHRLLKAGVKVIVTDSPVLLQCAYTSFLNLDVSDALRNVAYCYERHYPSLNFFVQRCGLYSPEGRYQSESQLDAVDANIQAYLDTAKILYLSVRPFEFKEILQTAKEAAYST